MLPAGCESLKSQSDLGQILLPERAEKFRLSNRYR